MVWESRHHNPLTQQQSMCCILIEQKIVHIHYNGLYRHALTSVPGVMKVTILVDPSLVIIIKYLVCLIYAWEYRRRFLRNNAFSLYDLYGHALYQNPSLGGHESYIFGRTFLGHHCYIFGLFDLCLGVERRFLKK